MKINSRSIRISQAKVEIPNELKIGSYDIEVMVKGDIVKEEHLDCQDGTIDIIYILKANEVEIKDVAK